MMELYDERDVIKARKEHVCEYCLRKIKPGERYRVEKGKFDGDFFSRACCSDCMPHTNKFWRWTDYECGDIYDAFCEYLAQNPFIAHGYRSSEES